jgi:hypothetical protein
MPSSTPMPLVQMDQQGDWLTRAELELAAFQVG